MIDNNIHFRKALSSDIPFLIKLRVETMEEHLQKEGFYLTKEEHKQRILEDFDFGKIIIKKDKEIGFIKLIKNEKEHTIEQFQITKKHQGQGIGKSVLLSLIEQTKAENITLKLSVLKGNKARDLYERIGFISIGESTDSIFMQTKF